MTDESAAVDVRLHHRVRLGLRKPANWLELVRFGVVGASGYAVNLAVFALMVHSAGADYRVAAVTAWLVAVANNFFWNRRWTFRAHDGHAGFQAARFLAVSVAAFVVNLAVLELLVAGFDMAEVPAQAIAIVVATPCNFLGNKLWSFAR
ncbi:GtrA family protein [Conexibacter sp. SYSU D00693]|uniref:GtrA family protein n=1 Tax=Conexibacter sp. SYSU D00693 TaxID=2812560 RepID=UPI00196A4C7E|nr:GtrA family protein [Conexibacter sp. SYSU D00693]